MLKLNMYQVEEFLNSEFPKKKTKSNTGSFLVFLCLKRKKENRKENNNNNTNRKYKYCQVAFLLMRVM